MANNQEYGAEARAAILAGVTKLNSAVRVTLGPAGRNVLFRHMGIVLSTKDGVTVAREIQLADPFESIGADLVKAAAGQTVDEAGDGTTTATLLTHAIFEAGCKAIEEGAEPTQLCKGIEKAVAAIVGEYDPKQRKYQGGILESFAVPCSPELAFKAARISSNGDEAIAKVVSDAVLRIGVDGALTIEDSQTPDHILEFVEGLKIATGYDHPYYINDSVKPKAVIRGATVLIVNRPINTSVEVEQLLKKAAAYCEAHTRQFALLVIADDYTPEARARFLYQKQKEGHQIICVRAPLWADARRDQLDDICLVTGAKRIESPAGKSYETLGRDVFGYAAQVETTQHHTTITTPKMEEGDKKRFDEYIERLKAMTSDSDLRPDQIDAAKSRLAALQGGVAVIKVGGTSPGAVQETKFRVEDAIHACRAAVSEGVVPGGGSALLFAGASWHGVGEDYPLNGYDLLLSVLSKPLEQIAANAGFQNIDLTVKELIGTFEAGNRTGGLDATKGAIVGDMIAAGIVDPLRVVRAALNAAASAACILLKTECVIAQDETTRPGQTVR
jgi:chaperonin GroEL